METHFTDLKTGDAPDDALNILAAGEILTATKQLVAADRGKTFFLNSATEFTTTLPSIADAGVGWGCRFVVTAAPLGAAYIVSEKATADTDKIITNGINELEVDTADDGVTRDGHTFINFISSKAEKGDWAEFVCDGTNWYCTGQTKVDGGITAT